MKITIATCELRSLSPYSQSRFHEEPKFKGELAGDYDKRTAHYHLHIREGNVVMPAHGFIQMLISAAKYSKKQIPGQGKATWTAKFTAGVTMLDEIPVLLPTGKVVKEPDVIYQDIYCNSDGIRGSGKRVMRRFPVIPEWCAKFDVTILDPIISKDVFLEILEIAGMFVGMGRFRPEKGGFNGRFSVDNLGWVENKEYVR